MTVSQIGITTMQYELELSQYASSFLYFEIHIKYLIHLILTIKPKLIGHTYPSMSSSSLSVLKGIFKASPFPTTQISHFR